MSFNTTDALLPQQIHFLSTSLPIYYSPRSQVIPGIPENYLSLAAPIFAYWFLSLIFHGLDTSNWQWLEKYRIHESQEIKSRNKVSKYDVILAVVFQQVLQTMLGYWLLDDSPESGGSAITHLEPMMGLAPTVHYIFLAVLGETLGTIWWNEKADKILYFVYWWAIPVFQFVFGMFFIDTWQYALHRGMHMNQFLYRNIHSVHHRLYVPYAFGALYNHPLEGFFLDSVGALFAQLVARMTIREAALIFTISTLKTVDDHCGYKLWFDPFQMLSGNNADYHDIHHQIYGIKSNFSQPFFIHWDALLGTRLTRNELAARKKKVAVKEL